MFAYLMFNLHGSELAILGLAFSLFAMWVWAIIHCAINEPNQKKKTFWLLLIVLCGYIGAPAYFVRHVIRKEK
jgi:hypothetical protein